MSEASRVDERLRLLDEATRNWIAESHIVEVAKAIQAKWAAEMAHYQETVDMMRKLLEGSKADEKHDKAGMKRTGMSRKQWEASPQDKKADARLAKRMKGKR